VVPSANEQWSSSNRPGVPPIKIGKVGVGEAVPLDWADGTAAFSACRVPAAPMVAAPIIGGHLEVVGNFTRAAVEKVAAELQRSPLPVPFRIAGTSTFNQSASS
jgi:hypothetical protein